MSLINKKFKKAIVDAGMIMFEQGLTVGIYASVFGVLNEDFPGVSEDFVQIIGDKSINCDYPFPVLPNWRKTLLRHWETVMLY